MTKLTKNKQIMKKHPIYLSKLSPTGDSNTLIILMKGLVQIVRWRYRKDRSDIISRCALKGNLPERIQGYKRLSIASNVS